MSDYFLSPRLPYLISVVCLLWSRRDNIIIISILFYKVRFTWSKSNVSYYFLCINILGVNYISFYNPFVPTSHCALLASYLYTLILRLFSSKCLPAWSFIIFCVIIVIIFLFCNTFIVQWLPFLLLLLLLLFESISPFFLSFLTLCPLFESYLLKECLKINWNNNINRWSWIWIRSIKFEFEYLYTGLIF